MAFLSFLFDRKVGGTTLGNTIRDVAHTFSPFLGNGGGKLTQEQADLTDLSDELFIAKYGKTKNGVLVPSVKANPDIKSIKQAFNDAKANPTKATIWALIKKCWYLIPLILIPFGFVIYWLYKKIFNKNKSRSNKRKY
jgi:hypothetical protein